MRAIATVLVCLCVLWGNPVQAGADVQSLVLSRGGVTRRFTASELLARADAAEVAIAGDVSYGLAPATGRCRCWICCPSCRQTVDPTRWNRAPRTASSRKFRCRW